MLTPSRPVGRQRGGFLTFHRASCHEDQVGGREPQHLAEIAGPGVVPVALQSVILDRAGDADPVARNSQLHEPAGVFGVLGRDGVDPIEAWFAAGGAGCGIRDSCAMLSRALMIATLAPDAFAARIRFGQSSSSTRASTVGRMRAIARRVAQLKSSGA